MWEMMSSFGVVANVWDLDIIGSEFEFFHFRTNTFRKKFEAP